MFTVCPKCALTLVVTAEDLRLAQGYVRCGRCSSVFNALARLTEEQPEAAVETPPPAAETSAPRPVETAPAGPAAEAEAIPEDALEFDPSKTDVTSVFVESTPTPQWTAATGSFKARIAANQEAVKSPAPPPSAASPASRAEAAPGEDAGAALDVELGPDLLASLLLGEPLPPPEAGTPAAPTPPPASREPAARVVSARAPAAAPPSPPPPAPAGPDRAAAPPAARAESKPPPSPEPAPPAREEGARSARTAGVVRRLRTADELLAEADAPGTRSRYAWAAGAFLALLVLLAQVVNHYRDELAASARFNRPLTRLYAFLGVPLLPHWDLHAYDVRQLGASVEPVGAGLITVRASVKNGAPQPQPLPLLRVTLQDRFGNRIAARDVSPRNYLPRRAPGATFLAAGERIDAEMGFVDPGANAVGFEIDACLPADSGEVSCANDDPAH